MSSALIEDPRLYLQLLGISQSGSQAEAREWFFREFSAAGYGELADRYPKGSRESHMLFTVLGFFDSVAVLISRGLLTEDVFFDSPLGFEIVWERAGAALVEWRKATAPSTWENVIWLGKRYESWSKYTWKSKLDAVPPDRPVRRRGA